MFARFLTNDFDNSLTSDDAAFIAHFFN